MGSLTGAHVLVTGAGVTGPPVARALLAEGAVVTVTDANADRLHAVAEALPGVRIAHDLAQPPPDTTLVVTAPGWRPRTPVLAAAAAAGIEVIGDVELAWRLCAALARPPVWLAVTGTNGKTTTVAMLTEILRAAGVDAVACGNIGLPVVEAVAAGHRVLAVELSSFQLYWAPSVRPAAGALLNIAEDHLDWHGDLAAYTAAKARVLTGDVAIAGVDDEAVAKLLAIAPARRRIGLRLGAPGAGELGVAGGRLVDRAFADDEALAEVADIRPAGPPGVFDALAAAALARTYGVPAAAVAAGLRAFQPAAHRAAPVAELGGVRYVDDSKATNPHAAAASLAAHQRVVWIAGGLLKGARVDDLVRAAADRLAGVVLIGADADVIALALARHAPDVPVRTLPSGDDDAMTGAASMFAAVRAARAMAQPGDVVLLAPAAASMDMFTDYRQRGRAFADAVAALPPEPG